MAQRRMISRRATESDKMLALGTNDTARWFWASLLPYSDSSGRLNADPIYLKATIFAGYPYTPQQIAAALDALASVGLVKLYRTHRHELVLEYTKFSDFNTPHKKEPKSDLPGSGGGGSEARAAAEALRESSEKLLGNVAESSENLPSLLIRETSRPNGMEGESLTGSLPTPTEPTDDPGTSPPKAAPPSQEELAAYIANHNDDGTPRRAPMNMTTARYLARERGRPKAPEEQALTDFVAKLRARSANGPPS